MRPRKSVIAALALVVACTLAACGGSSSSADGKVTLKLGYYAAAGDPADTTVRALVDEFTAANPNIEVDIQVASYVQFFQKLRTEIAGGNAPDVWLSDGVLVSEFAARRALADLSERVQTVDASKYFGTDLNRDADGHVYGFPQGAQTPVLFYNKELFAEANLDPPTADWTYDDLAAAARKLTKDTNGDGRPDVYGFRAYSPGFTESWWPIIKAFGGDIVTDRNEKVVIDSPQSVAALQWMRDAMAPGGFAPDVVTTRSMGNVHQMFATGRVAMSFGIYARTLPATQAGIDFGVAPLPKGPAGRGNVAIVNSWVVNRAATPEQLDAAWKWITFFSGPGPQQRWTKLGEAIPINKEVAAQAVPQPYLDGLAAADDLGVNGAWSEYTEVLGKHVDTALDGTVPLETALADGQRDAQQVIDRFLARRPK